MINFLTINLLDDGSLEEQMLYDNEATLEEEVETYHQRISFTYYNQIMSYDQLEDLLTRTCESYMSINSAAMSEIIFLAGESLDAYQMDSMIEHALLDLNYIASSLVTLTERFQDHYLWRHVHLYFREIDDICDEGYQTAVNLFKEQLKDLFGDRFHTYRMVERQDEFKVERALLRKINQSFLADCQEECAGYLDDDERRMDRHINFDHLKERLHVDLTMDDLPDDSRYTIDCYLGMQLIKHQLPRQGDAPFEKAAADLITQLASPLDPSILSACRYLAKSRYGLRLSDLRVLLAKEGMSFDEEAFWQFMEDLRELWSYHGEALKWLFDIDRQLAANDSGSLMDYLYALEREDPLRQEELIHQIMAASHKERMHDMIVDALKAQDETELDLIAETIYHETIEDQGRFLKALVDESLGSDADRRRALLIFLFEVFDHDYKRLLAYHRQKGTHMMPLVEAFIPLADSLSPQSHQDYVLLAWAYDMLGDTCRFFEQRYDLAVDCFKKAAAVKKQMMAVEGENEEVMHSLKLTYQDMAEAYGELGKEEKQQKYLEKSKRIA